MKLKNLSDTNKIFLCLAILNSILLSVVSIQNIQKNEYLKGLIGIIIAIGSIFTLLKWIKESEHD